MIHAGLLRDIILLRSPGEADAHGHPQPAEAATVAAQVRDIKAADATASNARYSQATLTARIRYYPGLTTAWSADYDGAAYGIVAVESDAQKTYQVLYLSRK